MPGLLYQDPTSQGILAAGSALLQAGSPSFMPQSLGGALGQAGNAFLQGQRQAQQMQQAETLIDLEKQKALLTKAQVDAAMRQQALQAQFLGSLGIGVPEAGDAPTGAPALSGLGSGGGLASSPSPAPSPALSSLPAPVQRAIAADVAMNGGKGVGGILMDASKITALRPGAPGVNSITGEIVTQPTPSVPNGVQVTIGPSGPVASIVPGYREAVGGINSIPNPAAPPTTMKTSSGREIQLSQPELIEYNTSGRLPTRYLATPQVAIPPNERAAYEKVASATAMGQPATETIGVVGATRSPEAVAQDENRKALGAAIAKTAGEDVFKQRDVARSLADQVEAIQQGRQAIEKGAFLGTGADVKTDTLKFLKGYMGIDLKPDELSNTEYLRSTLGKEMLDNAKKLGYNPTDADAKRLDTIIGTIAKDKDALLRLMDWREEMARKAIDLHNANVEELGRSTPGGLPLNLRVLAPERPKVQEKPQLRAPAKRPPLGTFNRGG